MATFQMNQFEVNAIRKFRRIQEEKQQRENNTVFDSLFAWGPTQQTISKSVEPGDNRNQCLDSCFPHL